ncbi:MAG: hypothetical protein QM775_34000 [Pirellulales bacterium]
MAEHAGPIVGSAGQHARSRRRADRTAGVEPVETQSGFRHCVEIRSFQHRVIAIAGLSPAHVVGHDENDVRTVSGRCHRRRCCEKHDYPSEAHHFFSGPFLNRGKQTSLHDDDRIRRHSGREQFGGEL